MPLVPQPPADPLMRSALVDHLLQDLLLDAELLEDDRPRKGGSGTLGIEVHHLAGEIVELLRAVLLAAVIGAIVLARKD